MVVMAFIISQMWNPKKQVTRIAKNEDKVSPKSKANIDINGAFASTERCTDSNIVNAMRLQAMTA